MTIRGILLTVGEDLQDSSTVPAYYVEAPDIFALFNLAGMEYGERVNTITGIKHGFVAYVDSDGHDNMLKLNRVGQSLISYPGPIAGNVLIVSEAMGPEGIEAVSLSGEGDQYVRYYLKRDRLPAWTGANAKAEIDTEGKREDRPGLTPLPLGDDPIAALSHLKNYGRY
jgi:hypothetical protein